MAICPQQEFEKEILTISNLSESIEFYSAFSQKANNFYDKITENYSSLFCLLKKLNRNELFMLEFAKNQVVFCQVLDAIRVLIKSDSKNLVINFDRKILSLIKKLIF